MKKEKRILQEHKEGALIHRRDFLKLLGTGVIVYFTWGESHGQEAKNFWAAKGTGIGFNAYIKVGENGRIICFTGKVELGQGIITSLAQTAAEELDVSLDSVDMVMGDTDQCPYDAGTFGSLTTPYFSPLLREASAEVKMMLIRLASERLRLPESRLQTKEGAIFDKNNPRLQISYGELVKGISIQKKLAKSPGSKNIKDFKIVGFPAKRTDALQKVTGEAQFAGDIRLPGMLYARILRPPAHGAALKSIDASEVEKMRNVQLVRENGMIAVLSAHPDETEKGFSKIKAHFSAPKGETDDKNIYAHLLKVAPPGGVLASGGDIREGERLAAKIFEGTYRNAYVAHAPMETHTAVAVVEKEKATVWTSTQRPFAVQEDVARAVGLPSKNVRVITPFVGGGFGGKSPNQQSVEAAILAKITGKPVQVAWTREEEFFLDVFRPAAIVKIKSGINKSNQITFWDYKVYFAGSRGAAQFYDIPHHRTTTYGGWWGGSGVHPFPTGTWRAPASNTNTFGREAQMDIMAAGAGLDPFEFRMKNLKDRRMQRVLEAAAKKFGWKSQPSPSKRGWGIACSDYEGTYVAMMAEVDVDKDARKIRVKRVACAQDMGLVINPEGAKMQMEGCIMMGLGYTLSEEIRFRGGEIFDLNFGSYEIPRFSWMPEIETVLIDDHSSAPKGCGEPAITCVGAAVANAVFDATGIRVYDLPIKWGQT
jgi:isoquinoline 1-oxidoreductase